MSEPRKQNTPQKYPRHPKGKINPREECPKCAEQGKRVYLKKAKCLYNVHKKQHTVVPLSFCKHCKYVQWNDDVLEEIPD